MIDSYSFGNIVINGKSHDDIKIIGEKIITWRYIEHHTVTLQDVIEIFEDKPEYVVIGTGSSGFVHVKQEVIDTAEEKGIKLLIEPTKQACNKYNELKNQRKKADAILHATC
ncbi:MAG: hypothetical protein KAU20_06065 [Nanoarchaeota archaeon]|nr:hypothetical protein [Nanoarchaeota archaeon]